jgi:hypothetical protein
MEHLAEVISLGTIRGARNSVRYQAPHGQT